MNTPDNITTLESNQIFVFGANKEGNHAAGAAKTAVDKFGAIEGHGEGLQGQSYGIDTMSGWDAFKESADKFIHFAESNPQYTFLLTKVGCGIAGYSEAEVSSLFERSTENVLKPKNWV